MLSTIIFFAIVLSAGYAKEKSPKIVGGEATSIETYPYIVQLEVLRPWIGWRQECGANILSSYWVMSAAHCFDGSDYSPRFRRIRAGSSYRNVSGIVHYVEYEINHPDYRSAARFDADINVVKLSTPLIWSPSIQRGTIITHDFELPDNLPVIHAGWGDLESGGPSPDVLQHVELYTINNQLCASRYGGSSVTRNMICAGLLDVGGRDACQGDSGGPLYAKGVNGQNVIVGIVSWGGPCADRWLPGVSTRVASYTNWVLANAR